jgi:hypothetical protein
VTADTGNEANVALVPPETGTTDIAAGALLNCAVEFVSVALVASPSEPIQSPIEACSSKSAVSDDSQFGFSFGASHPSVEPGVPGSRNVCVDDTNVSNPSWQCSDSGVGAVPSMP